MQGHMVVKPICVRVCSVEADCANASSKWVASVSNAQAV